MHDPSCHDPHAHLCSDHSGEGPTVWDLPIPQSLKDEWLRLETRRHFLGRSGKALAWAGLASILGRSLPGKFPGNAVVAETNRDSGHAGAFRDQTIGPVTK